MKVNIVTEDRIQKANLNLSLETLDGGQNYDVSGPAELMEVEI
jgi:hypothetical protein